MPDWNSQVQSRPAGTHPKRTLPYLPQNSISTLTLGAVPANSTAPRIIPRAATTKVQSYCADFFRLTWYLNAGVAPHHLHVRRLHSGSTLDYQLFAIGLFRTSFLPNRDFAELGHRRQKFRQAGLPMSKFHPKSLHHHRAFLSDRPTTLLKACCIRQATTTGRHHALSAIPNDQP